MRCRRAESRLCKSEVVWLLASRGKHPATPPLQMICLNRLHLSGIWVGYWYVPQKIRWLFPLGWRFATPGSGILRVR